MFDQKFIDQVRLLLQCLPAIANQSEFAIKGGTAINLFIQDLPRLSVDIDLTFINGQLGRSQSLEAIDKGLRTLSQAIQEKNQQTTINQSLSENERLFLISLKQGAPNFKLLPFDNVAELPAIKWKLLNIQKMDKTKHREMLRRLETLLT
ncbi:MAG: hypothetical protein CMF50_07185 [Legionellales bacterium]|nr:hypothetical protein [Legionellales bacterium]|tara:strand:+ start:22640 stop:23089 length:450 start_codon:yes stop_codon:yes gene_type:complete